jgi:hypothetical protein
VVSASAEVMEAGADTAIVTRSRAEGATEEELV